MRKRLSYRELIGFACSVAIVIGGASATAASVSLDNWQASEGVKEGKELQKRIDNQIQAGEIEILIRRFDVESDSCEGYPIERKWIAEDAEGRVRLLGIRQERSHGDPFEIRRYYDSHGSLRYVDFETTLERVHIYLDRSGDVADAVREQGGKYREWAADSTDWEVQPAESGDARAVYSRNEPCSEIGG